MIKFKQMASWDNSGK